MSEDPVKYLSSEYWRRVQLVDVNYTFERYEVPLYVQLYIKNNWNKINDDNGGTYQRPEKNT